MSIAVYSCGCETEKIISISFSANENQIGKNRFVACEINRDKSIYYLGGNGLDKKGYFEGRIDTLNWSKLEFLSFDVIHKYKDISIMKSFCLDYYYDLKIMTNKREICIKGFFVNSPVEIKSLLTKANGIVSNTKLKHFKKSKSWSFNLKAYLDTIH